MVYLPDPSSDVLMRLRLSEGWPYDVYRSPAVEDWKRGTIRDVSEEVGAYLCDAHPGYFQPVVEAKPAPAPQPTPKPKAAPKPKRKSRAKKPKG